MALFKILKGNSTNLPTNKVDGYCYVTLDEHKLYVDYKKDETLDRFALNAVYADTANIAKKLDIDAGDSGTPIYFSGGIPTVCGTLNVNTTGNAATATKASQDAQGNVIHSTYVPFTQDGMTGLFASGVTILSSNQYGSTLPINGVAGQLFFKKI